MIVKQCFMTNSYAYKNGGSDKKTGIVVHSTGVNNAYVKRYVQPDDDDPNRATILADIGTNKNKNDWNHKNVAKGVHAFIGKNASDEVVCYQVIPYEKNIFGTYHGENGSYNEGPNARVQFEICEDALTDGTYFNNAMNTAIEYCAFLCKEFGWTENDISSHHETGLAGYGSDHIDPEHWLKKFGKDMNWFRSQVKTILDAEKEPSIKTEDIAKLKEHIESMAAILANYS